MLIDSDSSTLVLIDLQRHLIPAIHQNEAVVKQSVKISEIAKLLEIPIIGTLQSPNKIGPHIDEVEKYCDKTLHKEHFNACRDGLIGILPLDRPEIILAGCETHICVLQTALGLLDADYSVTVIIDAVGSRNEGDKNAALTRLEKSGAVLTTTEMLAYEWLNSSNGPLFKEALEIIKAH